MSGPALVLFTRDLRTHDHPALAAAARAHDELVPLFVLDQRLLRRSANRTAFLLDALADLRASLGGALVVREGRAEDVVASFRPRAIYVTADTGSFGRTRERALEAVAPLHVLPGTGVVEPGVVTPAGSDHYRVFTPYWRAWAGVERRPLEEPVTDVRLPDGIDPGTLPRLSELGAGEPSPELARGGETEGRRRLASFLERATFYDDAHDLLAVDGTSRLSPYLRFGCISALEVATAAVDADAFVRQLCWRDFYLQLRAAFPRLWTKDYRPRERVWSGERDAFEAWREGLTGVPVVDAGMRQLRREGWMHNRARLLTGSFLVKRLGVDWRLGLAHFDELLVDGDPASNAGNWQWVAGTGTDTRPNRVLNPIRQARRFDPDGDYVRRFVPELHGLDPDGIHEPWKLELGSRSLDELGYPPPLVEL